ncbi:YkyA family protein, partial [Bacillus paranthracis]|nr:YkyA family protein [Bacillus paranthracis]
AKAVEESYKNRYDAFQKMNENYTKALATEKELYEKLKVKETNRIDTVVAELTKLGARIEATDDGMIIYGKSALKGNTVNSYGDHRIGMMLAIAGCLAEGKTTIEDAEAVGVSYPTFFEELQRLTK